jgi:hypothetical protein
MLVELKRLYEKHGDQSTADVIAKATGRSEAQESAPKSPGESGT